MLLACEIWVGLGRDDRGLGGVDALRVAFLVFLISWAFLLCVRWCNIDFYFGCRLWFSCLRFCFARFWWCLFGVACYWCLGFGGLGGWIRFWSFYVRFGSSWFD